MRDGGRRGEGREGGGECERVREGGEGRGGEGRRREERRGEERRRGSGEERKSVSQPVSQVTPGVSE